MHTIHDIKSFPDAKRIPNDGAWDFARDKELKIHQIHSYPAKFPAFIASKAIEFIGNEYKFTPRIIADIFCGCGTTAFEAKRAGIDFWGCDINPVATLIARAKSHEYKSSTLDKYFDRMMHTYYRIPRTNLYKSAPARLKYWYLQKQYNDLAILKEAITLSIPGKSYYKHLFFCAFSNILKPTSRWLTKAVKPQIDPDKKPADVIEAFNKQFDKMRKACAEVSDLDMKKSKTMIANKNFLDSTWKGPAIDMIVTSPPYVTSYEYADLHQLSSLWLGYAEDHRDLRKGTVGSSYHSDNNAEYLEYLNSTGKEIVENLIRGGNKSQAKSVAKYFFDMQKVSQKCFSMLSDTGYAFFVIGNTEYKGVSIGNAEHLSESLLQAGFFEIDILKRKINHKISAPHRDKNGKFSSDLSDRKIYAEEFIIIGKKA